MTGTNPYLDEVIRLRARVAELEAERAEGKERFDARVDALIRHFGITVYQARLLAALASGRVTSRAELERDCGRCELTDPRNVDALIKRTRRRNLPGITILNVYGAGYRLAPASVEVVQAVITAHQHEGDCHETSSESLCVAGAGAGAAHPVAGAQDLRNGRNAGTGQYAGNHGLGHEDRARSRLQG